MHNAATDGPADAVFGEAIARKLCVAAVYNRRRALLAPHLIFQRHGELYVRAVTIELDGSKPREAKLGTFKLSGLSCVALTRKLFRPQRDLLATAAPGPAEALIAAIA